MKHHLSLSSMENLLKDAGAERVSEEAKFALRDMLEAYASEIGKEAWFLAQHAKRKTVKKEDIIKKREKSD